ncbi:EAL domain-containing protein [Kovacikia minuta CCNUW1]|uniref:EAL domain-containing protein n=1 Tax=Kovacikia minuta TaxID=2931930 RepID=UPI001CCBB186|nr:EAL domain-containing protein [Kovacikia minuta]UBF28429.1 EAL domain-containing protein [Kovacikia minuta CCNUW1]
MRPVTPLTDPLKLIIQPYDLETGRCLCEIGFVPIPVVPQLLYRPVTNPQLSEVFLQMSQLLSQFSQAGSRYCITRSPLDSKTLLVEFLDAQPLNTITDSARYAWFLQVLAKQQLFFKYQPIFDLRQGHIAAYECLARARNDAGHYFTGQQLIEAALSMNLMHEFDDLARSVCLQAIAQSATNPGSQNPQIFFINILPNAIIQNPYSFEQNFRQVLDLGLHPEQIVFELTELEALVHCPELSKTIHRFRNWGFRFAIDDLCGNVSTDHYFMEFRPDFIKIDRRLVSGCSRYQLKQILLKSLLHSAHELGILVLAEGLEEPEDIEFCRELGVDYGQGFGLALPERTLQSKSLNLLKLSNVC